MRRVWFKKEMKQAILDRRKTATSRPHALPMGQVLAVSGSRFKAEVFAILEITDRIPSTWENIIRLFYKEEGFESPEAMHDYGFQNKLITACNNEAFFHRFKIVEVVKV